MVDTLQFKRNGFVTLGSHNIAYIWKDRGAWNFQWDGYGTAFPMMKLRRKTKLPVRITNARLNDLKTAVREVLDTEKLEMITKAVAYTVAYQASEATALAACPST